MNSLHQILYQRDQLQQLKPEEGPTGLAFYYDQLNGLVKAFLGSQPTQEAYVLASSLLDKQGRTQLTAVLDQYAKLNTRRRVRRLVEAYEAAFRQLQHQLCRIVLLLPHHESR